MAATVSAWSKPGAWALDSEEHEAELLQNKHHNDAPTADFPSLAVAAATKPKKKKAQTLSLAQFTAQPTSSALYNEDPISLPTGPRQRTADEIERDRNRLGGGFRSYGDRSHRGSGGDEDSQSRWGSSRVSDEPRRNGSFGSRDSNRELAPSRADEIDNWAAAKKPTVGNGYESQRRERGAFFDSQSRADESDSWISNKKNFVPSEGRRFGSNGGGGFERERKVGFGSSGGADSDNWNSKKKVDFNGRTERNESSGNGRPRLVLQPRSSQTVSNGSQEAAFESESVAKPKGANPFGEARPREQVLAEKGQDWKKIDEELETKKIKDVVDKKEGFGKKRGFGSGNGRGSGLPDDKTERSWRKAESDDGRPQSAGKVEDGPPSEEN